jgi:hypothetical protein
VGVMAKFSYAGMRAQGSLLRGWRVLAFIFGLPGTLVTYLAVEEDSETAYGVALPKHKPPSSPPTDPSA